MHSTNIQRTRARSALFLPQPVEKTTPSLPPGKDLMRDINAPVWTAIGSAVARTPQKQLMVFTADQLETEDGQQRLWVRPAAHAVAKLGLETSSPLVHDGLNNSAWEPRGKAVTSKGLSPETQVLDLSSRTSHWQPGLGVRL